jgi:SAM-dependent methyltransferase
VSLKGRTLVDEPVGLVAASDVLTGGGEKAPFVRIASLLLGARKGKAIGRRREKVERVAAGVARSPTDGMVTRGWCGKLVRDAGGLVREGWCGRAGAERLVRRFGACGGNGQRFLTRTALPSGRSEPAAFEIGPTAAPGAAGCRTEITFASFRICAYTSAMGRAASARIELYRLLADEARLRLFALCHEEELSVGELAELVGESQPQVSKKAGPLRKAGLLDARKDGSRTLLRAAPTDDPVARDALDEGRRLCAEDGSLARVPQVVALREEAGRAFFEQAAGAPVAELAVDDPSRAAHLFALGALLPGRQLAIDVGCGEGLFLDVLSPAFDRVIALDRSEARLARCSARVAARGLHNVSLLKGSWDDLELIRRADAAGGADVVFAGRVLHHAARPKEAVAHMARLLKPGGHLLILDYLPHADDGMRAQGDVWLGFEPGDLDEALAAAGLRGRTAPVPAGLLGAPTDDEHGPFDLHLPWQLAVGRRTAS